MPTPTVNKNTPQESDPNGPMSPSGDGPVNDAPSTLPYDPVWPAADPGVQAMARPDLAGGGPFGSGYISFADYMRGNQDTIQGANDRIGADALTGLNTEVDKFHQLADTAAGHTAEAHRAQMDQAFGFDTSDAERRAMDVEATRAAHTPEQGWFGAAATSDPNVAAANAHLLPNQAASSSAYDLAGNPLDVDAASAWLGNQSYGQASNAQEEVAKNKAADVGNMDNWGGVFDAYMNANKGKSGYGRQAGAFDATVAGAGLHGAAEQAQQISKGLGDYTKNAIQKHAGDQDNTGYKGQDLWQNPAAGPTSEPWVAPGTDDSGSRQLASGGARPTQQTSPGEQNGTQTGATDDSGANRNGQHQQNDPGTYDPNDPWGNGNNPNPWGNGG